jgi:hypothetical protein
LWVALFLCLLIFTPQTHGAGANVKLEYQIAALETLQQLDLSTNQIVELQKLVATVKPVSEPGRVKMTPEYEKAMSAYRKALLAGDDDKIADADDKLSDIRDKDPDSPEAEIDATESARKAAPQMLALLHPSQIAGYMSEHADDVPDPVQTLLDAVDEMAKSPNDSASIKSEAAEQVAMLLVGLDPSQQAPIIKKVNDWFDQLKSKRDTAEASAREIVGKPDPMQCLRHWLERDLADLLANPELPELLKQKLKNQ